ncbi:hypothetical protein QFC21_006261 [Naganishia friedmannii]|uniref:Uncharacterized protein n=1 Tax=Naganishia friedmannii TaxID=89922 RepID=A0ACC2V443_9TREE|nr:hypothetical protein QFC21_006261 [Naganishia friedmannii]
MSNFTDRRRLPGPEKSFPPLYEPLESPATTTNEQKGKGRADGRADGQMRDICRMLHSREVADGGKSSKASH